MARRSLALAVTVVLTSGAALSLAQERQVGGGVGLTMFADSNFRGEVLTFRSDIPNLTTVNLFRLASSLQVAPGEQWEVCEEPDYGGACFVVSGSEPDLRQRGWNDRIASARRVRGAGRRGGGLFPSPDQQTGIELYSNVRFYGERQVFTSAVSNLYQLGFNDRAMSFAIPPNEVWEVCVDADFRNCRTFNSSVMNLEEFGLARNISSLRPIRQGRGGIFRGNSAERLMLFDNRGFGGQSITIEEDTPVLSVFANRAESLRVSSGSWEICDGPRFTGRCITITGDLQDLSPIGFANQIQSVRRVAR